MDWDDFLNMSIPFKPKKITGGITNGRTISDTEMEEKLKVKQLDEYIIELAKHQIFETEKKLNASFKREVLSKSPDDIDISDFSSKEEILKKISENLVVVIRGRM